MGTKIGENISFLRDRTADIDTLAEKMKGVADAASRMEEVTTEMARGTHVSHEAAEQLNTATEGMRDHLADFDDFWRPPLLFLLGTALFRHPHVLVASVRVRVDG
ncbi:hypothetical protein [Mycobacterium servetii]|uniref:Methyl-accepting chemotaxis protein n=1 Tax=Mycobacterium servetii TaxID=3237418 RepID=A0ABV4C3S8_9MYCO